LNSSPAILTTKSNFVIILLLVEGIGGENVEIKYRLFFKKNTNAPKGTTKKSTTFFEPVSKGDIVILPAEYITELEGIPSTNNNIITKLLFVVKIAGNPRKNSRRKIVPRVGRPSNLF
jgi:hypothetical protein